MLLLHVENAKSPSPTARALRHRYRAIVFYILIFYSHKLAGMYMYANFGNQNVREGVEIR